MALRPCLGLPDWRCPNLTQTTRCRSCEAERQRRRNASPRRQALYGGTWAGDAKRLIEDHRMANGDVCPGWRRGSHVIDPADWTCDHLLGPLCRSCNSTKAGTTETPRR